MLIRRGDPAEGTPLALDAGILLMQMHGPMEVPERRIVVAERQTGRCPVVQGVGHECLLPGRHDFQHPGQGADCVRERSSLESKDPEVDQ